MQYSVSSDSTSESAASSGISLRALNRKPSTIIYKKDGEATDLKTLLRNIVRNTPSIKTSPKEDRMIRIYDTLILFLCCLGIAIMIFHILYFWDFKNGIYTTAPVQILKLTNIAITGLLFVIMSFHTKLSFKLTKREWKGYTKYLKLRLSIFFYIKAVVKFIICAVQPLPFVQIDVIGVFMFLRLFAVIPVLRDYHPIYVHRREITKNKRFATTSSAHTFSSGTCVKAFFALHPIIAVTITVIISFCIAAFCVTILERDHHTPEEDPNISYVYMALITITTVGYGDYSPNSPYGRAACVVTGFVGIITTAFFINMISSNLQLTPLQKEASDWTVHRHQITVLHNHAASFIQLHWRHYIRDMKKAKFHTVQAKINAKTAHRSRATKNLKKLRNLRRKLMVLDMHAEDPVLDKILTMEQTISSLETQNKMLLAKLDNISTLLMQSPRFLENAPPNPSSNVVNGASSI